jgi:GNAT superfamily N-acetyltransferase
MTRIVRLSELTPSADFHRQIDAIFFESAGRKHFASTDDRSAYRDLWLGRYLRHFPDWFFAALDGEGRVSGYLAGSPVSNRPPLPGPDYYQLFPRSLIDAYPAHMHVNVRQDWRGQRVGSDLASAFRIYCQENEIAGLHAVTAAGSRSAQFFKRCRLNALAEAHWGTRRVVLLGQDLRESR